MSYGICAYIISIQLYKTSPWYIKRGQVKITTKVAEDILVEIENSFFLKIKNEFNFNYGRNTKGIVAYIDDAVYTTFVEEENNSQYYLMM